MDTYLSINNFFKLGLLKHDDKICKSFNFTIKKEDREKILSMKEGYIFAKDEPEMQAMLQEQYTSTIQNIENKLFAFNPVKRLTLELRAGVGGDEAALFVGDLFDMYRLFCEKNKWKMEILSISKSSLKGIKNIHILIKGKGIEILKYESGVHRVQRVPATEVKNRVHTSAASVVAIDVPEVINIHIAEKDIRIDRYRASGAGGQHVNTTDSAVRLTHIATGVVVQCQDQKSQHQNYAKALDNLKIKLYEHQKSKQEEENSAIRNQAIKSNNRSDKIRTYNYPQDRMTDHRNGEKYNLKNVMLGKIDQVLENYQKYYRKSYFDVLNKELDNLNIIF